jgi:hypothetical protein
MEKFLRGWRQDALNRSQNETAVYVGDKILALTSRAFLLAYFWYQIVLTTDNRHRQRHRRILAGSGPLQQQQLHTSTDSAFSQGLDIAKHILQIPCCTLLSKTEQIRRRVERTRRTKSNAPHPQRRS